MQISEIFYSIQGEGIHSGLPTTFIRFQFCPFNCSYCDTKYGQDKSQGTEMSTVQVIQEVQKLPWKRICITGGEPLCQPAALAQLVIVLGDRSKIEVETSGLMPLPWKWNWGWNIHPSEVDSWVLDVKCPSSEVHNQTYWPNLENLRPQDQVKFVVGTPHDLDYAEQVMKSYPNLPNVIISPVWKSGIEEETVEFVKEVGGRLGLQLHKILWGEKRGV